MQYEQYMKIAIEEAKESKNTGNKGFGAVIVKEGRIIAKAHDNTKQTNDPSSHAEMNAIRLAAKELGPDLNGCTLICTCEPCPMCAAAAIWANIDAVAYGASIEETIRLGRKRINLPLKELNKISPHKIKIAEGVLKEECLELYK